MSDPHPIDRFEAYPVFSDGFDVQTSPVKDGIRGYVLGKGIALTTIFAGMFVGFHWGDTGPLQGLRILMFVIDTHHAQTPVKLKMLPDEADELVRALRAAKLEVKMRTVSKSGYRDVRVEAEAQAVDELSKIDTNNDTAA